MSEGGAAGNLSAILRKRALRRVLLAFAIFRPTESAQWIAILVNAYRDGGTRATGSPQPDSACASEAWSGTMVSLPRRAHVAVVALARRDPTSGISRGVYGTFESRCAMQLSRARRLSSVSTTYQGASGMSVCSNITSFAREYSTHFVRRTGRSR